MALVVRSKSKQPAPKNTGHAKSMKLEMSLDDPGRVRVGHLMFHLGLSHSSIYAHLKLGLIPPPDGRDPRPYWKTSTVKTLLDE